MAERIKEAYAGIFKAHEYAYKLDKKELTGKLKTLTGASDKDNVIPAVVGSFQTLCELADFDAKGKKIQEHKPAVEPQVAIVQQSGERPALGISYTINLNLPATSDGAVFDAIFKSLKEHLLK